MTLCGSLETTRTSITRLKHISSGFMTDSLPSWNDKNLDYEIETFNRSEIQAPCFSWNDKNLDYEIETPFLIRWSQPARVLETTRTSITRLKLSARSLWSQCQRRLKRQEPRLRDWNILETSWVGLAHVDLKRQEPRLRDWNLTNRRGYLFVDGLETTRTSITRLKLELNRQQQQHHQVLKRQEPRLRDWNPETRILIIVIKHTWNDKNLDYEIETLMSMNRQRKEFKAWNDKNLDYEIET